MKLLSKVNSPADLKLLSPVQLSQLSTEIRSVIISQVEYFGGHLGSNLAVVELTVALHYVFNSPLDRFIFDTGHQCYAHKILTGRRELPNLRQSEGISGYPWRKESEHDWVENSHSGSALAWLAGFAYSQAELRHTIAVVGDGALGAGPSLEALNLIPTLPNAGGIIVLNDNGRSYASTQGALSGIGNNPKAIRSFFEILGYEYFGPLAGHDLAALIRVFEQSKTSAKPVVIHVKTQKGRGYEKAENDYNDHLHTYSPAKKQGLSGREVFSQEILKQAKNDPRTVALSAAMVEPTGLLPLQTASPNQVIDVGISEQFLVTFASSLAANGYKPVVCLYSTFLNRAWDQLLYDAALHNSGITFIIDRAGITGVDGPSHHGQFDLSLLRQLPGAKIWAPSNEGDLRRALKQSFESNGELNFIRYSNLPIEVGSPGLGKVGDCDVTYQQTSGSLGAGVKISLVGIGAFADLALKSARLIGTDEKENNPLLVVEVLRPNQIWPLPIGMIDHLQNSDLVVVIEDGGSGGISSAIQAALAQKGNSPKVLALDLGADFLAAKDRSEILSEKGLTPEVISDVIHTEIKGF